MRAADGANTHTLSTCTGNLDAAPTHVDLYSSVRVCCIELIGHDAVADCASRGDGVAVMRVDQDVAGTELIASDTVGSGACSSDASASGVDVDVADAQMITIDSVGQRVT